jgi:hypothetical protein
MAGGKTQGGGFPRFYAPAPPEIPNLKIIAANMEKPIERQVFQSEPS